MNRTRQCVEQVYAVFSTELRPRRIDACPCCIGSSHLCDLVSRPLRQISPVQLSAYASAVFLTAGSEADYRYFLPRILEVSLQERPWWPDRELVLGRLALAGWQRWSAVEIRALTMLFEAGFDDALVAPDDPAWEADSWICGLSLAGVDVMPYLGKLLQPAHQRTLLAYFEINAASVQKGKLTNPFWFDHKGQAAPVVSWFNSAEVQSAIARCYGGHAG